MDQIETVGPRRQDPMTKGPRATPAAGRARGSRIKYLSLALAVALAIAATLVGDVSAQSSEPPTNVLVNPEEEPDASARPWLARDPARSGRLAIAYNKNNTFCSLARSADDGATWENAVVAGPGALPVGNQCSRPSIAYGADGTLYYTFSAITGGQGFPPPAVVFVMASRDGGATFTGPVRVSRPGDVSDINPSPAVDRDSGRLYVVWQANRPGPANIEVASSSDGGQTFSTPARPFPTKSGGPGAVSVGPDGRVYVARRQTTDYAQSMGALPVVAEVASSTDGARTFGEPVAALRLRSCFSPDNSCQRNAQGAFTFNPSISFAAGNSPGQLLLAGSYLGDDDTFRFRLGASTDAGRTWTETAALGVPSGLEADHQLVPNVAVAPNGRIDIAYYNLTQPNGLEDTYLISSFDGGSTFSTPRKLSSAPSPTTGTTGNEAYSVGHLLTSSNDAASVAWTDARREKLDIFFARALFPVSEPIPVTPPVPPVPPDLPGLVGPCGVPGGAGYLNPAKLRMSRARVLREDRRLDVLAPITSRARGGDVAVTYQGDGRTDTFDEEVTDSSTELDHVRFREPITRGQAELGTGIVNLSYLGDEDTRPEFVRLRAASRRAELDVEEVSLIGDRLSATGSVTSRAEGIVRLRYSYVAPDGSPQVHEARAEIGDDGDWELEDDQVPAQLAQCGGYLSIQFTGYFERRIRGEQLAYELNAGQTRRP